MDAALRALNRFGLGARVGERGRITDPRGWLNEQLDGGPPALGAPDGITAESIGDALRGLRVAARGDQRDRQQARQRLVEIALAESRAALARRVTSDRPFVERLVAFWSNHLCVSAGAKLRVSPLAGSYERDVIRPHVLGRFEDMVLASAQHPAMLLYLDNSQSIGPGSQAARRARPRGAERGLNENYARELLELHTLGVDGGYTQQDVVELARILTGWTVAGLEAQAAPRMPRASGRAAGRAAPADDAGGAVRFVFRDASHEPGTKTVLGASYVEAGVAEGEQVIRALCRHPSTASFVATKLVTHFIADEPPASAVDRVARAFREGEGDLHVVASTLVDLPEAWREGTRKFRTPQDWLVAVQRAFNAVDVGDGVPQILRQLRHPLWSPQAPKGFGDTTREWADPESLLNRAELARGITRRFRVRDVDPRTLLDLADTAAGDPLRTLLADRTIAAGERVALAIAGPAFQWR